MKLISLLLAVLVLSSCEVEVGEEGSKKKGKPEVLRETVLEGQINGKPWIFESGRVEPSVFGDERSSLDFWDAKEEDPCSAWESDIKRKVFGAFELEVGAFELSLQQNVTFLIETDEGFSNLIATDGVLVIEEITDEEVHGQLLAIFDDQNQVNGSFVLKRCE